jgi:hypothetical protein
MHYKRGKKVVKVRNKLSCCAFFLLIAVFSSAHAKEDGENATTVSPQAFVLKAPAPCEDAVAAPFKLPDYLLTGQEFKESALSLRLALSELLYNHSPNSKSQSEVISDEKTRKVFEDILHDRMPHEVKTHFSEWEHLLSSIMNQSDLLYRHTELGLDKTSLAEILKREVPTSVQGLMVPSANEPKNNPKKPKSFWGQFLGLSDSPDSAIKRPAALDGYRYISAPHLYKMLFRFDERLRLDLLKTLLNDPATQFPQISHLESYIIVAALPRNQQSAGWDLLVKKIITRVDLFPARYLIEGANLIEPEAFLKSLAANQGQLRIEEILNLIQQSRGRVPLRIEEIAKGSNFPQVSHFRALELIEKYRPLDFESAYAIAWSYAPAGRTVEELDAFLKQLESVSEPELTAEQSEKLRSKVAERMWPLNQSQPSGEKISLIAKIAMAKLLKVGPTFISQRLYWELQSMTNLTEAELLAVIDFIPLKPERASYDGTKPADGSPPRHEVIYKYHFFPALSLELRFQGSSTIKWYYSDFYWMGITTNLVIANMALERIRHLSEPGKTAVREKIHKLFEGIRPVTPAMADPKNKWNIRWDANANPNVYSFNPSEPDELAPVLRGVSVDLVLKYFAKVIDKLVSR